VKVSKKRRLKKSEKYAKSKKKKGDQRSLEEKKRISKENSIKPPINGGLRRHQLGFIKWGGKKHEETVRRLWTQNQQEPVSQQLTVVVSFVRFLPL